MPCKTDDFPKLDLECLMKPFRNEIQAMSLEIIDRCNFYFNIIDLNNGKSCKQSNQVKNLIFEGGRERKSVRSLRMLGFGVCFGGTPRDYALQKTLKMRKMQTSSTPSTSEFTCNLEILAQADG